MSTKDKASELRSALKRAGYTQRDVSVRCKYYSGGSNITATIHDPRVDPHVVKDALENAESISRDQFGEILGGGNTYVNLRYDDSVLSAWGAEIFEPLRAAIVKFQPDEQYGYDVVPGLNVSPGDRYNLKVYFDREYFDRDPSYCREFYWNGTDSQIASIAAALAVEMRCAGYRGTKQEQAA